MNKRRFWLSFEAALYVAAMFAFSVTTTLYLLIMGAAWGNAAGTKAGSVIMAMAFYIAYLTLYVVIDHLTMAQKTIAKLKQRKDK